MIFLYIISALLLLLIVLAFLMLRGTQKLHTITLSFMASCNKTFEDQEQRIRTLEEKTQLPPP